MIRRLEKWEHRELFPRIGGLWSVWKIAYDLAPEDKREIWIDENSEKFIIIEHIETPDAGMIPVVVVDCYLPFCLYGKIFDWCDFFEECGFRVVGDGRHDLVVKTDKYDNFDHYLRILGKKSFFKILKKGDHIWNTLLSMSDIVFLENFILFCDQMKKYWDRKLKLSPSDTNYRHALSNPLFYIWNFLPSFTFNVVEKKTGFPIAFSLLHKEGTVDSKLSSPLNERDVHWLNTWRWFFDDKFSSGKYLVLKMIQWAFENNLDLNMGIHVYDYKLEFKPDPVPVKGLRYLNSTD